jgi:hypothetical protein
MRKLLIATAAAAGLIALGACQPTTTEDETDMAEAADDSGMDASAEGDAMTGESGGSGDAAAASDTGSDASTGGAMAPSGDSAVPAQPMSPTSGSTDPMVTGQGSTSGEGQIQMGSEPPHPARQ